MDASLRKTLLVLHILAAGIWIGVDVIFAVLVLAAWASDDSQLKGVAYQSLAIFVVWPMLVSTLVCLGTGVGLGLGTRYGLVRYWWVAVKLVLNIVLCALVLFALRPAMAQVGENGRTLIGGSPVVMNPADLFFPPAVSLSVLTFATILAVFKPWGRIRTRGER